MNMRLIVGNSINPSRGRQVTSGEGGGQMEPAAAAAATTGKEEEATTHRVAITQGARPP